MVTGGHDAAREASRPLGGILKDALGAAIELLESLEVTRLQPVDPLLVKVEFVDLDPIPAESGLDSIPGSRSPLGVLFEPSLELDMADLVLLEDVRKFCAVRKRKRDFSAEGSFEALAIRNGAFLKIAHAESAAAVPANLEGIEESDPLFGVVS